MAGIRPYSGLAHRYITQHGGTYTTGPVPLKQPTPYHVHGCVDDIHPAADGQYGPFVDM